MIIGITGKSGSGKSKIATELANQLNAKLLSIDLISHQATETDKFKNFVKENISKSVFDKNGNIIRKALGEIVFKDPKKLDMINECAEKIMNGIIDSIINHTHSSHIILEYALLPKMKYFDMCDIKILVNADETVRQNRIIKRDNISEEYFLLREKNSLNYYNSNFDIIIENNSNEAYDIKNIIEQIQKKEKLC